MLFAALIERVRIWRRERETLAELKRLTDRDLTDIGINLGRLASGEPASERRILGVRLGLQVSIVLSFVSGAAAGEAAWMLSGTGALRLAMIPILISVIYDVLLARAERLNPSQFASGGPGPSDDEPDR